MKMKNKILTVCLLFLYVFSFSCTGTYGPGQQSQNWIFTFKNGVSITGEVVEYDDRKTEFVFRAGREQKSFFVDELQSIRAAGGSLADAASLNQAPEETDLIEKKDGSKLNGIFWNWSSRDIAYRIPEEGEQGKGVLLNNLRRIVFGKRVFTVERINFKKGMNFYSVDEEITMGSQFADQIQYEEFVVEDPIIKTYIQNLGDRLVRSSFRQDLSYDFNVINSDQVNAFAVPGGHVYVYRGLIELAESESELAGVMGHEVGHIAGYHSAQQLSKTMLMQGIVQGVGLLVGLKNSKWGYLIQTFGGVGAYFAQMKFSRDDEREADYMGVYTLYKAGYQPAGMMHFFEKMHQNSGGDPGKFESFFQSHPRTKDRIENAEREIQKLPADASLRTTSPAFDAIKEKIQKLPKPFLAAKDPGKNLNIQNFQFQPPRRSGSSGTGNVTIRNTSEYIMSNIVMNLHFKNSRGSEIGKYAFGISGSLMPGESTTLDVYEVIAANAPQTTAQVEISLLQSYPVPKVRPELKNQPRQIVQLDQ